MAMEKMFWRKSGLAMILLGIVVQLVFLTEGHRKTHGISRGDSDEATPVKLVVMDEQVVMDNEIVKVTLAKPEGFVTDIEYKGIHNVLNNNREHDRGYWDIVGNQPALKNSFFRIKALNFSVVIQNETQLELSFSTTWDPNSEDYYSKSVPLKIDIRYVMLSGSSGFYAYAIFEREEEWPAFIVDQIRIVFKLAINKFHYMAVSDDRQRIMPEAQDRATGRPLDYPEAVLLTNPTNPNLTGEVDDKYQYSNEFKDDKVHGWISFEPLVGFWIITPSYEFRPGGPFKQELTSHVGPISLSMFESDHYGGLDVRMEFQDGEPWKKVFGPVFLYLNSNSSTNDSALNTTLGHGHPLWQDAKRQMLSEAQSWPYNFPCSSDYISNDQRGTITGQLLVNDSYVREDPMFASFAYVGLAAPGPAGSWQRETKGYQFWINADEEGHFLMRGITPGIYSLYASVPGVVGDYKYESDVTITPGCEIDLGSIVFSPPRNGPTLWEIGIPDRSAAEFYIPDPDPCFINHIYLTKDRFRQYGLWDRYTVLYPDDDLIYTVGASDYRKDWFFAHVNRNVGNGTYRRTTWQIKFEIPDLLPGAYTLQMALASASGAEVQIRVNDPFAKLPHHTTKLIGKDNAIARHGIHGLYWPFSFEVPSTILLKGNNTIYLLQNRDQSKFSGVMYDYIRLEGPPTPTRI